MVEPRNEETLIQVLFEFVKVFFFVYLFLVSIDLMGIAFKSSGEGLKSLMQATTNPFIGLAVGIVTTSINQSSSTTTSIIVALVGSAAFALALTLAARALGDQYLLHAESFSRGGLVVGVLVLVLLMGVWVVSSRLRRRRGKTS